MLAKVLKTILTLSIISAAALAQPGQNLRRAVALLDYVAGDYAQAVDPSGKVISPDEYAEQQGFVAEAARELRSEAGPAGEDLARRLDDLLALVEARAAPDAVQRDARAVRDEIAQRFKIALLPVRPPAVARGSALYAQACASCHGADGHAPPKEKLELATQPPSFAASDEVKDLPPQRIFSATTYGVPNTAMPGFEEAFDDAQRWDLAFFALTLAHPKPADATRALALARAALVPSGYRDLATLSDAQLRARLVAAHVGEKDQEAVIGALRAGPFAEDERNAAGFAELRRDIDKALGQARAGDRKGARESIISAYLDRFEPHEPALRARDPKLVADVERQFLALRTALDAPGADPSVPAATIDALLEQADARGPTGALVAFVAALVIALREGVEAALLVAALLAILRKADRTRDAHAVHWGWIAALAAGAVTWWASGALLVGMSGARREAVEGAIQLVTAALLLYASHWLLAAASAKRMVSFLSQRTARAASATVVFGLAFAAIYREMFEVVLFFRGLLLESPGAAGAIAAGAGAGLLCLVALVAAFQKLGRRLRPRPLLLTCGVLLCALAVLMVGNGVRSLQEVGFLPLTVWSGFEVPSLGVYGTREGLLAQACVVLLLVGSAVWSALRARDEHKGEAPPARAAQA
jgi:high-affinity iron transporter